MIPSNHSSFDVVITFRSPHNAMKGTAVHSSCSPLFLIFRLQNIVQKFTKIFRSATNFTKIQIVRNSRYFQP